MFQSDSKISSFFPLRKYFLETRMKIGLVKINIDADIQIDWNLGKGLSRNNLWSEQKLKCYFCFVFL